MLNKIGLHDNLSVKNEPFQIDNYMKLIFILWGRNSTQF